MMGCKACEGGVCTEHGDIVDRAYKRRKMAEGGRVEHERGVNKPAPSGDEAGESFGGRATRMGNASGAKAYQKRALRELQDMRGQNRQNLAEGGEVYADEEPNDFDYLEEEHIPETADYTGANSGDEDDRDIISRVMKKRRPA